MRNIGLLFITLLVIVLDIHVLSFITNLANGSSWDGLVALVILIIMIALNYLLFINLNPKKNGQKD